MSRHGSRLGGFLSRLRWRSSLLLRAHAAWPAWAAWSRSFRVPDVIPSAETSWPGLPRVRSRAGGAVDAKTRRFRRLPGRQTARCGEWACAAGRGGPEGCATRKGHPSRRSPREAGITHTNVLWVCKVLLTSVCRRGRWGGSGKSSPLRGPVRPAFTASESPGTVGPLPVDRRKRGALRRLPVAGHSGHALYPCFRRRPAERAPHPLCLPRSLGFSLTRVVPPPPLRIPGGVPVHTGAS